MMFVFNHLFSAEENQITDDNESDEDIEYDSSGVSISFLLMFHYIHTFNIN